VKYTQEKNDRNKIFTQAFNEPGKKDNLVSSREINRALKEEHTTKAAKKDKNPSPEWLRNK
jgi:hypothetical protein